MSLSSSPHAHQGHSVGQVMRLVLLALVPGASAFGYFFGWGVLINIIWLVLCALLIEAGILHLRKLPVGFHLRDCTAILTAVLLALALPPTAPWWLGLCGLSFALIVGKHCYGGLGQNLFNPAMVGYAVLLIAFPLHMTRWLLPNGIGPLPGFVDSLAVFFGGEPFLGIDAYIGATWLDSFQQREGAQLFSEFRANSALAGNFAAHGWEWINAGFAMGGVWLIYKRVISWHIPVAFLGALTLWSALGWSGGSSSGFGSPVMHLFSGATMLGAFFIATDPITASTTPRGRLIYAALIGTLLFVLRAFSQYPDGLAFAVLLGNLAVPLIDTHTIPRTFGHKRHE